MYELRDQAWFDRGTGHCKGVYDDQNDVALLIVEAEEPQADGRTGEEADGPGGFLKDELLLHAQVTKEDQYTRQQGGSCSFSLSSYVLTALRDADCLDRSGDPT